MDNQMLLGLFLVITGLTLLAFGILYGMLIYFRPFPPNLTSMSVVIGVAFTEIGIIFAVLMSLIITGHPDLWWLVTFPAVAYLLTGLPQIYVERRKAKKQAAQAEALEREMKNNGL